MRRSPFGLILAALDLCWRRPLYGHGTTPALTSLSFALRYDGRLEAHASAAKRRLSGSRAGDLVRADAGLVVVDVPDDGVYRAATANLREAAVVARVVEELLDARLVEDGETYRELTADDVLVVCPYNAHVRAVEAALAKKGAANVRVGTVDRFQGREAPCVVASLCVAAGLGVDETDDDAATATRGAAFALDRRRLNVALSRAQCLAVLVAAPELADGAATSLDRMRELAMLARLRELAVEVVLVEDELG